MSVWRDATSTNGQDIDIPGVILAVFEVAASGVTLLLSCHLSYQLYGEPLLYSLGMVRRSCDHDDCVQITSKSIKIFSIIALWLYAWTSTLLAFWNCVSRASFAVADPLYITAGILWTIGQLSCYNVERYSIPLFLWISRLRSTFEGSYHQLSRTFYIILYTLAGVFAAMMGLECYELTLNDSKGNRDGFTLHIMIWIVVSIVDSSLSVIVMYTFLSKLQHLTAHCRAFSPQTHYRDDVHAVKLIKAEAKHFKSEKKQLRRKMKEKQRAEQRHAIVPPLMVEAARKRTATRGQHLPQHKSTFSRLINDYDPLDEIDIVHSTRDESVQYTPSSTTTYSPPTVPGLQLRLNKPRGNTVLINSIISDQTTMTREDVASPDTTPPPSLPSHAALVSRTVPSPDGWIMSKRKSTDLVNQQPQSRSAGASPALEPRVVPSPNSGTGSTFTTLSRSKTSNVSKSRSSSRSFRLNHMKSSPFKHSFGTRKSSKSMTQSLIQMESVPLGSMDMMERLPSTGVAPKQVSVSKTVYNEDSIFRRDSDHVPLSQLEQSSVEGSVIYRKETTAIHPSPKLTPCDEEVAHDLCPIDVHLDTMRLESGECAVEVDQKTTPSDQMMSPTEDSKVSPERLTELVRSPSVYDQYRKDISLDDRQKLLVIVMTKYTVLSCIAVLTTQLFVITGVVVEALDGGSNEDGLSIRTSSGLNALEWMFYFLWSADCAMGSLCCYLNFKMNDPM